LQKQDTFGLLQTPQGGVAGRDFGDGVHQGAYGAGSVAQGFGRGYVSGIKKIDGLFVLIN
jgi:hypothetical protein